MRTMLRLAALAAVALSSCQPAVAQRDSSFPVPTTLDGTERVRTIQGSGCATATSPCANVETSLAQISSFILPGGNAPTAAKLATARTINGVAFDGSAPITINAVDSTPRLAAGANLSDLASVASAQRNLGLIIGTTVETQSANLDALAALSGTNTIYYRSGANTWSPVALGPNFAFASGNLTIPGLPISISGDATGSSTSGSGAITLTLATVPIGKGGTGATTVAGAQAALGVSATGTDPAFAKLTGASFTGPISASSAILSSPLAIGSGGTGAATATAALTAIGGQPLAANLTALSSLNTAADNCDYWTGSAAAALYACPTFGRSLMGSTSASTAQATLGLGSAAMAAAGTSGHVLGYLDGSNTYSGAMIFSQTITGSITGNAGSATSAGTLTTGRTFAFTGDIACTSAAFNGSANLSTGCTLVNSATARGDLGAAASGANADINGFSNNLRVAGRIYLSPQSGAGAGPDQPTLGTALTTSPLIFTDYTGQYGLATGVSSTTGNVWLQSQRFDNSGSIYNLVLQPAGGNVLIGTGIVVQKLTVGGGIAGSVVQLTAASTVANLATCNAAARGTRTVVTDATAPMFLGTLTGGGSVVSPAFCNGSAWVAG